VQHALSLIFFFAYTWAMGGNQADDRQDAFDDFAKEQLQPLASLPGMAGYCSENKSLSKLP
jgi:hypothetical protein